LFELMNVPLCAPDYSCVSKRARTVKVAYRQASKGKVTDLVIDSTGLKVFGEGEWKVRKHGAEKRRVWRKLHLAVYPATHDIVAAEVSLDNVHDAEVLPTLLNPLRRSMSTCPTPTCMSPTQVWILTHFISTTGFNACVSSGCQAPARQGLFVCPWGLSHGQTSMA
jgi:Transposase DDE domain